MCTRIRYKFGGTALGFPASAAPAPVEHQAVCSPGLISVPVAPAPAAPVEAGVTPETLFDIGQVDIKAQDHSALDNQVELMKMATAIGADRILGGH